MLGSRTSGLLAQAEVALLAGRNLDEIERELRETGHTDEDEQAAAWLYAWSLGAGAPTDTLRARGRTESRRYA